MSFATTMTALKDKVDGLIANRVAKFAYTQQAYNSDDVNGVTTYDFNNEQNVPTSSASVLKVNETVLTKGWRTQASAITRMLMNHFLGRTSYNLNKTVDFLKAFMLAIENNMGVADGFATLDTNAHLPLAQLTPDVMTYKGEWNAETNTPYLEAGTGRKGDAYYVSTNGMVAGLLSSSSTLHTFRKGDFIIYNDPYWRVCPTSIIHKVNKIAPDIKGNIELTSEDINISSSDVTNIKNKMIEYVKLSFTPLLGRYFIKTTELGEPRSNIIYLAPYYYGCFTSGIYMSKDGLHWSPTEATTTNIGATPNFILQCPSYPHPNRLIIGTTAGIFYSNNDNPLINGTVGYFSNINDFYPTNITSGNFDNYKCGVVYYSVGNMTHAVRNIVLIGDTKIVYSVATGEGAGATWEDSDLSVSTTGGQIFYDGDSSEIMIANVIIGSAYRGAIYKSTDYGLTWTAVVTSGDWTLQRFYLAPGVPLYVAHASVGASNTGLLYSDNYGSSFTQITTNINVVVNNVVQGADVNKFVAVTASGIRKAENGITDWTTTAITSGNYSELKYANGMYLASIKTGSSVRIKYSYDMQNWQDCNIPASSPYHHITYFNGVWITSCKDNKNYYSLNGYDFYRIDCLLGQLYNLHLVNTSLFAQLSNKLVVSSVDDLIERGWVNID